MKSALIVAVALCVGCPGSSTPPTHHGGAGGGGGGGNEGEPIGERVVPPPDPFPRVTQKVTAIVELCSAGDINGAMQHFQAATFSDDPRGDAARMCDSIVAVLTPSKAFRVDRFFDGNGGPRAFTVVFPDGYSGYGYYFDFVVSGDQLLVYPQGFGECPAPGASFMPYACDDY